LTTKKVFFGIISLLIAVFVSGCFQSADRLYEDGKALVSKSETQSKGLEKLLLFEKRFYGDSRAPEVVFMIAGIQIDRKEYADAESTISRLTKNYPESTEACKGLFLLGYTYYDQLNNKNKAKEVFGEFIKRYPKSELAVSAKTLIDNMDIPVEQWPVVKQIEKSKEQNEPGKK
jgi:TolA-binding protein